MVVLNNDPKAVVENQLSSISVVQHKNQHYSKDLWFWLAQYELNCRSNKIGLWSKDQEHKNAQSRQRKNTGSRFASGHLETTSVFGKTRTWLFQVMSPSFRYWCKSIRSFEWYYPFGKFSSLPRDKAIFREEGGISTLIFSFGHGNKTEQQPNFEDESDFSQTGRVRQRIHTHAHTHTHTHTHNHLSTHPRARTHADTHVLVAGKKVGGRLSK